MRNKTGKPFALKTLNQDEGIWCIYFDPGLRLDGLYYYEQVKGPCDGANAQLIVDLLNEYDRKSECFDKDNLKNKIMLTIMVGPLCDLEKRVDQLVDELVGKDE